MTATASSYRVIVSPSRLLAGQLEYEFARAGIQGDVLRDHPEFGHLVGESGADRSVWVPLGSVMSPACTDGQALQLALAWLRLAHGADPDRDAIDVRVEASRPLLEAASAPTGYGRRFRRRWWERRPRSA